MTYEVIVKMLNEIEYKGLFSLHNNKIYIRSLIDEDNYESMFKQLIDGGYVNTEKIDNSNDYTISLIEFHNNLENIFNQVRAKGIDITFDQLQDNDYTFSVIADGEDLNPQVMAHLNKGTKIIGLSENLFKYANNVNYEPKINIRASSYAVDVQEINNNDNKLIELINSINNDNIDVSEYLTNYSYSNTINSIFEVVGIETLDTLKIKFRNETELTFNINAIKNIKRNFRSRLSSLNFIQENINTQESLRAFDDKKHRVLLDISPVYHLHFANENIYSQLKNSYNSNNNVTLRGSYKGKQTIEISRVDII